MQTPITRPYFIEEEIEELGEKLLCCLPSSTKLLLETLKGCGKCLGYQRLNDMEMER